MNLLTLSPQEKDHFKIVAVLRQLVGTVSRSRTAFGADTTIYVRTDGSDNNTGLANTAAGAFKTPQAAYDAIARDSDTRRYATTIKIGNGTYSGAGGTDGAVIRGVSPLVGGTISIEGDTTTPGNVIFDAAGGYGCYFSQGSGCLVPKGIKFIDSVGGFNGASIRNNGAIVFIEDCEFGSVLGSNHIWSGQNGAVTAIFETSIKLSGGAAAHYVVEAGAILDTEISTYTITGTPAFSYAFASVIAGGILYSESNTYNGSATGTKFILANGGTFFADSFDLSMLPGDVAGTIDQASSYQNLTGGSNSYTFGTLPSPPATGMLATVTDSNTTVWGANIAGTGLNKVLAFYNGTNWTVAGK